MILEHGTMFGVLGLIIVLFAALFFALHAIARKTKFYQARLTLSVQLRPSICFACQGIVKDQSVYRITLCGRSKNGKRLSAMVITFNIEIGVTHRCPGQPFRTHAL